MSSRKKSRTVVPLRTVERSSSAAAAPAVLTDTLERMKQNVANQMENTMQNASEQIEKVNREFISKFEEVAAFNRNNFEAYNQAANILAAGLKDLSQAVFTTMQSNLENTVTTSKAMMGVKTMRDLFELQSQYMKSCFDSAMSESTKLSEIAVRCTSEAAEPINNRVTAVVETIADRTRKVA